MIHLSIQWAVILFACGTSLSAQDTVIECRWGADGHYVFDTGKRSLSHDDGYGSPSFVEFDLTPGEKRQILETAKELGFFAFPHRLSDSLAQSDQRGEGVEYLQAVAARPVCKSYYVRIETSTESNWSEWNSCVPPRGAWIKYLRRLHRKILDIVKEKPAYRALPAEPNLLHDLQGIPCK